MKTVESFSGKDYKQAYIQENAKQILKRFDNTI